MKAAVFHQVGIPLRIEDIPEPTPGPHEVVLKVARCGMCGSDVSMTSGSGMTFPLGVALGHEYCGEVVALGREVTQLRMGDHIAAMPEGGCGQCEPCRRGRPFACISGFRMMLGGFGEYTLADERFAVRLPSGLSAADGALVEPMASALRGVKMASIGRGDRILVLGAGAMGGGSAYWSRRLGAGKIVTSSRSPWRAALMFEMGATSFLESDELAEGLGDALEGFSPDVVFECTGVPGMLAKAIDLVRPGGTVVCIGICTSIDSFLPATAVYKEVVLRFSAAYDLDDFQVTVDAFEDGAVEPRALIDNVICLDALPAHLEAMRAGKAQGTKTQVDPALAYLK